LERLGYLQGENISFIIGNAHGDLSNLVDRAKKLSANRPTLIFAMSTMAALAAGYTQLLAKRYQGQLDQTADDYIAYAVDGVKRMQRLIDDLLSYSRVGAREKEFAPADCEMILNTTLAGLGPAIQANGAIVTHDPLSTVMGDAGEIGQLLQNLIANGIKYCDNRVPEIHVSCQRQGRDWLFSVKDNGIGIDPQYAEKIFVIFQRLHTKQEYPGTGIGLALCKKVIQHHGGRIWVESQIQEGATFYFTLPAMEEAGIEAVI
jgi:light-regulated signal transduction histidine kinase (bacteriophytochrome)